MLQFKHSVCQSMKLYWRKFQKRGYFSPSSSVIANYQPTKQEVPPLVSECGLQKRAVVLLASTRWPLPVTLPSSDPKAQTARLPGAARILLVPPPLKDWAAHQKGTHIMTRKCPSKNCDDTSRRSNPEKPFRGLPENGQTLLVCWQLQQ